MIPCAAIFSPTSLQAALYVHTRTHAHTVPSPVGVARRHVCVPPCSGSSRPNGPCGLACHLTAFPPFSLPSSVRLLPPPADERRPVVRRCAQGGSAALLGAVAAMCIESADTPPVSPRDHSPSRRAPRANACTPAHRPVCRNSERAFRVYCLQRTPCVGVAVTDAAVGADGRFDGQPGR